LSNALANETSPYLLQHAENPVAWLPWGEEAFARARNEDKPIFLSVGYAACHWCHVMAHESFEDSATAALLNEHFIPIKVDREERPDVDSLYMDAVVALTGRGGWPMSVFLTPDGKPFYGGTYFPPERRHGLPAFREILQGIDRAWKDDRESLMESATRVTEHVTSTSAGPAGGGDLRPGTLDTAAEALWRGYDGVDGGWGGAPKFPAALAVEFLLRRTVRNGDKLARDLAVQTLEAMAAGGIYDQLGGGFHRYSVDAAWRVPHFEKMLYDNALLARVYLQAWHVTGRDRLLQVARGTLDFLLDEMMLPEGGLASSLDADTEGEEGRYYIWTDGDFRDAIGDAAMEEIARTAWGVTPQGNFEGRNVLVRAADAAALEARFGGTRGGWREPLAEAQRRLLAARGRRPRPALDDKVLTAWNGLALMAFAEAARILEDARYLAAAQALAEFLLEKPWTETGLARSWRAGRARYRAYLEDHAALGVGLLAMYQTDFSRRAYAGARERAEEILLAFADPEGGFFDTRDDHEPLLARPKTLQDSPVPSGSTLATWLMLILGSLTGENRYEEAARAPIAAMQDAAARHPTSFAGWLCALDMAIGPMVQLALIGSPESVGVKALARVAHSRYMPNMVVAAGDGTGTADPPLLRDRPALDGEATAYLCRDFACELPTKSPDTLANQLDGVRG
jgi:uncharacterized protein YyaL (SSP411 family)